MHESLIDGADLRWLDETACADLAPESFFVEAGHVIDPAVLALCQTCPVRRECISHAYTSNGGNGLPAGYFGGFSPGYRKHHTLVQALEAINAEQLPGEPDGDMN
jgi:hypothetical protein